MLLGEFNFTTLMYDLLFDLRNFEYVRNRLSKEEELLQHALNTVYGRHTDPLYGPVRSPVI